MTLAPVRLLAVAAAAVLSLSACGGGDAEDASAADPAVESTTDATPAADGAATDEASTDEASTDEASTDEATADPPEPPSAEGPGTASWVVVDGALYDITTLRRCVPPEDGVVERELELQGFGEADGKRVQIDVYVQEVAGAPMDEVAWAGPEGIFGGPEDADVTYDGGMVRGTATLVDAMEQVEQVRVEFELEVPDELLDCR